MVLWVNFSDAPATVILIAIIHCQTRKNSVIFDYNCTGTHLAKQVALHYMHQIVRIEMTSIYQIQPVRQSQTPGTFPPVSLASLLPRSFADFTHQEMDFTLPVFEQEVEIISQVHY